MKHKFNVNLMNNTILRLAIYNVSFCDTISSQKNQE